MDEASFWRLIDETRREMTPELSDQPEILRRKLAALPPAEIVAFDRTFFRLHAQAYRWDLWAAAYIIEGGCSDDGFMDFRAGLIALGREVYLAALDDPASLVQQPTRGVDFSQEAMLYAAKDAYEEVTGEEMPEHDVAHAEQEPDEPVGERWDEASVASRYPALAAKFGHRP